MSILGSSKVSFAAIITFSIAILLLAQRTSAFTFGNNNSFSNHYSISGNGRYVAFESDASNLVPNDTNNSRDIFVCDTVTSAVVRASVSTSGAQSDSESYEPSINFDGTKVAFRTNATNLDDNTTDTNGNQPDIYVRNLTANTTVRVSTSASGVQGPGESRFPAINADGTKVAFSTPNVLVAGDTNNRYDIYIKDLLTGALVIASTNSNGQQVFTNGGSNFPAISADGTKVAFVSDATDLALDATVTSDTNNAYDIFLKDMITSACTRISVDPTGHLSNDFSYDPVFSGDGTKLAFYSLASNLVPGDNNGIYDVFVRNLITNTTVRASVDAAGHESPPGNAAIQGSYKPSLNFDGTKVAFYTSETFASNDIQAEYNSYVKDLVTGIPTLVSVNAAGVSSSGGGIFPSITSGGTRVAFTSIGSDIVPGDSNGAYDVFVRDFVTSTTTVAGSSPPPACDPSPSGMVSWWPAEGNAHDVQDGHDGTLQNGTTFTAGIANQAFSFDGVNDSVDLGNWFNLQTFTIDMWVNPATSQGVFADIIDNNHTDTRSWVLQYQNVGEQYIFGAYAGGVGQNVTVSMTAEHWQHIAITRDTSNTLYMYLNGVLVDSAPGNGALVYDGSQFMRLSNWGGGGRYWNGQIDELHVFNRALSAAEIAAIYNASSAGVCTASTSPQMNVKGLSNNSISDGDATPSTTDGTDFGNANVGGTTVTRTFTIQNNGNAPLLLTGIPAVTISGTNAADFSVSSQPTSAIASGTSATFSVQFAPSSSGPRTALISIPNNDSAHNPYDFAIQGQGTIIPGCTYLAQPASADFTAAGGPGSFTVNTDSGCLWTASSDAGWINVTNGSGSGFSTVNYTVAANTSLARTGHISVNGLTTHTVNQAAAGPTMDVRGNGNSITDGDATPSTTDSTDFSSAVIGQGTVSHQFSINNTGGSALLLTGIPAVQITGTNASDFSVTAQPGSNTITPGSNDLFTVRFAPATGTAGLRTATVTISNNDTAHNPYDFAIQGTSTAPPDCSYSVTPTSTNFGVAGGLGSFDLITSAGCTWNAVPDSAWLHVTSSTSGSGPVTISYSVDVNAGVARTGHISAGGASHTVTQDAAGPNMVVRGNSITIPDGDTAPATADGTAFGSAVANSGSVSHQFAIHNTGGTNLLLTGVPAVQITGTNASDFSVTGQPLSNTVSPGSFVLFSITFSPSAAGTRTATVSISSNDIAHNPYDYAISGTGTSPCTYTINPVSADFTAAGGTGSFGLTTGAGCQWDAISDAAWLTVTDISGVIGSGSATIHYSVAANGTLSTRVGHINAGGQAHTVTQGASGPDLTGSFFPIEAAVCKTGNKGTQCRFRATMALSNIGSTDSTAFVVRFYVSEDDTVSTDDLLLKDWKVKKLKVAQTRNKKINVRMPLNVPATGKHLIGIIDADNTVAESDENNNRAQSTVP